MADQIEVPKITQDVAIGAPVDNLSVGKLVMFILLTPSSAGDTSNRQGHVHTQIIRRD